MKDNEKNLNNALSDEAAESVAGGFRWPWQSKSNWSNDQKEFITQYIMSTSGSRDPEELKEVLSNYSPETFLKAMKEREHNDYEYFKKGLGL